MGRNIPDLRKKYVAENLHLLGKKTHIISFLYKKYYYSNKFPK